ncbi:unnamed protein product, partial [Ixodes hexagonus]
AEYRRLLRVDADQFAAILSSIASCIQKTDTEMRPAIPAKDKLQLTLRFLASGESQHSLSRQFRISHSAVNGFLVETCDAIYKLLGPKVLVAPRTKDEWLAIMKNFYERWQFPHCIGALDGKHVAITKPANSGSVYFNYKKTFSVVLFALVDAESRFLYIDVGAPGSDGDGGIWRTTPLRNAIENGKAGLPISGPGPVGVPPVIVGDDAFLLSANLMKPYTGTMMDEEQVIFNYRLSRARRVAENAFGILANRFRFLHTTIDAEPERVTSFVKAACVLHNYLRAAPVTSRASRKDNSRKLKSTYFGLQRCKGRSRAKALDVRERLRRYFNDEGAVAWQREQA